MRLAFCTTVDGCLGSENYGSLIFLNFNCSSWFDPNRAYTLVSRSKSKLFIFGSTNTIDSRLKFKINNNIALQNYKSYSNNMVSVADVFIFSLFNRKIENDLDKMQLTFNCKINSQNSTIVTKRKYLEMDIDKKNINNVKKKLKKK